MLVPYGLLILDLKQTTPESRRYQTDIFRPYIGLIDNSNHHLKADRQGDWTSVKLISYRSNQHLTDKMAWLSNKDQIIRNILILPLILSLHHWMQEMYRKGKSRRYTLPVCSVVLSLPVCMIYNDILKMVVQRRRKKLMCILK